MSSREEKIAFIRSIQTEKVRAVCTYLDRRYDLNFADETGLTPLIHAIKVEKEDVRAHFVRLLVKHKCDVNIPDRDYRTPLMYACILGNRDDVIRRLISSGVCDPNKKDKAGNSALWYAASNDNHSALRILVNDSHTKDTIRIDDVNKCGGTALSEALDKGHIECVKILATESGASVENISNKDKLFAILNDRTGLTVPNENDALLSVRTVDNVSLRLDRISLHSRSSMLTAGMTGSPDHSNGAMTPVDYDVIVHQSPPCDQSAENPDKLSKGFPILDSLSKGGNAYQSPRVRPRHSINQSKQRSDTSISVISNSGMNPHADMVRMSLQRTETPQGATPPLQQSKR